MDQQRDKERQGKEEGGHDQRPVSPVTPASLLLDYQDWFSVSCAQKIGV